MQITPNSAELNHHEILRYSRHLIMPEVGMEGQLSSKQAKVLCVGAGGLGSPVALLSGRGRRRHARHRGLRRRGLTNLQRQIIHCTSDVGRKKLDSAATRITAINPERRSTQIRNAPDSANALESSATSTSSSTARTTSPPATSSTTPACFWETERLRLDLPLRRPGQRLRHQGRPVLSLPVSRAAAAGAWCRRCAEGGVLGILPGLVGVIQATETIKLILGAGRLAASDGCCWSTRWPCASAS